MRVGFGVRRRVFRMLRIFVVVLLEGGRKVFRIVDSWEGGLRRTFVILVVVVRADRLL